MLNSGGYTSTLLLRGLRKAFGDVVAVDGLDLEVKRGECFGLLGPNGAGKTTTIEICEGLTEADAGSVELLGLDWRTGADELRQRIGVQLQETQFPDKLTVEETLRLFRSFYRQGNSGGRVDPESATGREARRARGHVERRAEAAARHGLRAGGRSGAAVSGRADDWARSAGAASLVGPGGRS